MTVSTHRPAVFSLLTSHIQLCLAHYCDLHGPTPLMVTEGLPVPCARCSDDNLDDAASSRSGAASSTTATSPGTPAPVTAALRKMNLDSAQSDSATVPEQDAQTNRAAHLRASKTATKPSAQSTTPNASAVQTPPQSPRRNADGFADTKSNANSSQRDCSFQRTYDESVTKHANPCANCSLTLPKRQDAERAGNKSDKAMDPRSDPQGPTMRTRAPYARVYGSPVDTSPPRSNPQSSYTSDAEEDAAPSKSTSRTSSQRRPTTSTSQSSAMSKGSVPHHTHYLDYTSTHEPTAPTTFTIVRASCLRTLSLETLPRRPEATQSSPSLHGPPPSIPPSMNVGPGYITAPPTPQPSSSGGPILFGDATAGYTTAYIFRIPDMHARGRKRVYAFLALSTHRERLAMKAFSFISAAFRDLAAWIQELVEAEAEREREREEGGSAVAALNAAYGTGGFGGRGPHDSGIGLGGGLSGRSMERSTKDRDRDTSSFLSGGGRSAYMQRMGGSMGPSGFTPKARGLAELAGLPDFFIELHTRFVKLLLELGVVLGS